MASFDSDNFFSSTLHSSMFLPDEIWISRPEILTQLKESNRLLSVSEINDSDLYSTVEEIDTSCLFSDEQDPKAVKPKLPPRKHRKIHFQDEIDQPPAASKSIVTPRTLAAKIKSSTDVKSVRSAIESLEEHQSKRKNSESFMRRSPDVTQDVETFLGTQRELVEHHDSFSAELNNFIRLASDSTKKVFRKIKSAELVTSPKKLWRRNNADATVGSSESLSSAGPSALYQLPQDMSPVSNSPGGSNGTSDMDTPFNAGRVGTRTVDNYRGHTESQDGHGLLRRKASGALNYMQKWKVASTVGGLIPKSRTRNGDTDTQGGESAWYSTREERCDSGEDSLRKRLARSLSF